MTVTAALTIVILIVTGIGTATLVMALRPNSKIEPGTLARIMNPVIVVGLSAALALLIIVLLNK